MYVVNMYDSKWIHKSYKVAAQKECTMEKGFSSINNIVETLHSNVKMILDPTKHKHELSEIKN